MVYVSYMLGSAAHTWLAASIWADHAAARWACCCVLPIVNSRKLIVVRGAAAAAGLLLLRLVSACLYLQPRCHVPRAHTGLYGGLGPWVSAVGFGARVRSVAAGGHGSGR